MDVDDVSILATEGLLFAWTCCWCLLKGVKSWRDWDKNIGESAACQCLREFGRFFSHGEDDRVAMRMAERRSQRMRIVAVGTIIVQTCFSATFFFNIFTGRQDYYSMWMGIAFTCVHLITVICNVWPGLLSCMPNLLYSALMAWCVLHSTLEPIDALWGNLLFAMRMSFSMAILDMRTIMFWNAVNGIATWCQFFFIWKDYQCSVMQLGEFAVAMTEISQFVLLTAICYAFKQAMLAEIREQLGASASRRECGAVSSLLRGMSDVVVKLDSGLRVLGDCPTLAAMLLRDSVRGTEFESFLFADDDIHRFQDCLASTAGTENDAIVPWRIRLRDGVGTCVTADLFHAELEDVAGKNFHMIGIRELQTETEGADEAAAEVEGDPASGSLLLLQRGRGSNSVTAVGKGAGGQRGSRTADFPDLPRDDEQPRDGCLTEHGGQQPTAETLHRSEHLETASISSNASNASNASSVSRASNTSRRPYRMLVEGFDRTTAKSQRTSMLKVLTTWNFPVPSIGCCSYHASINEARSTIKNLARARCCPLHEFCPTWQCVGCGILAKSPQEAMFNPFTRTCFLCSDEAPSTIGKTCL